MALINCPECGRQISERAPSCPGCGILKEDIQAIFAEQNAVHSSMEQKNNSRTNDFVESQGTEEELLCYPTVSVISERERTLYSEKHEMKSQKAEQAEKAERKVKKGRAEEQFNVGDIVTFGMQYAEPIRWIVLETKGDDMLLLSEKCLEFKKYHSKLESVTWETSDIRRYLNDEFLEKHFSDKERRMIMQSILENPDNPEYGTRGGNCTLDKVFLLSLDEERRYFTDAGSRACTASEFARKQAEKLNWVADDGTIVTDYWLRSPGSRENSASMIYAGGYEWGQGNPVTILAMIRPALVVHLDE